jgi:hypothetical protein
MKKMQTEEMAFIEGSSFISGFCSAIASVGTGAILLGAVTGVGVAVIGVLDIGCGVYGLFN